MPSALIQSLNPLIGDFINTIGHSETVPWRAVLRYCLGGGAEGSPGPSRIQNDSDPAQGPGSSAFTQAADGHGATVRLCNMICLGPRPGEERCHIARVEEAKRAKHGAAL